MKYSKFQKTISYFLLFIFFFNIIVQIPSITFMVLAKESSFYNLVSIIVDEKSYGQIKNELDIYGKNISNNLENTKVVILPVPENATDFSIASMNEGLYFDGYKSLSNVDFESKLIGTVFVGNIKIPRVYKGEEFARTVLPYVDFDEKSFIYNKNKSRYEENPELNYEIKPEIEFGFISPNTGNFDDDIKNIKEYFSKNNDFYTGKGIYSLDENLRGKFASGDSVINGLKEGESGSASGKPYVFYYDYIRENKGLNTSSFPAYLATRAKNEDLSYGWYTKALLDYMSGNYKDKQNEELIDLAKKVNPDFKIPESASLNTRDVYDIQTKLPIEKLKKNFLDSFSKATLGELRKDVFNAGRYNFGEKIHVDFIPHILSKLDIYSDNILKSKDISEFESIRKSLDTPEKSRKIAVPVSFENKKGDIYRNFLFGNEASTINTAGQCSFYRGTNQLVEANRGNDISISQKDFERLESMGARCVPDGTIGLWGKNSPLNLDENLNLVGADTKGAIENLFNINGSKLSNTKNYSSPYQCFDNNFLLFDEQSYSSGNNRLFKLTRYKLKGQGWTCLTDNNAGKTYDFKYNHIENDIKDFKDSRNNTTCDVNIFLEGNLVRQLINEDYYRINFLARKPTKDSKPSDIYTGIYDDEKSTPNCLEVYNYKAVDSLIGHNEPTPDTINSQSENLITPNLPIDANWYFDYIGVDGKYSDDGKPVYSSGYFRKPLGDLTDEQKNSLAKLNQKLKVNILSEIEKHPYFGKTLALGGDEISNLLRKNSSNSKSEANISEPKPEELDFARKWNYFSPNQKYAFIFDNYLKDKGRLDLPDGVEPFLPDQKEQYEISYFGANGSVTDMMIGFHPELKDTHPFADTIVKNQDISSKIFSSNVAKGSSKNTSSSSSKNHSTSPFKCAPPDGVPIWEWMDAVKCRLDDMLPPKINISEGTCSASSINFSINESDSSILNTGNIGIIGNNNFYPGFNNGSNLIISNMSCSLDEDKNGISDCLEKINKLKLTSDSSIYSKNSNIGITASFYENENKANFINNTFVNFQIQKIEKAKDETKEITNNNLEIVFDILNSKLNDKNIIGKYINFTDVKVPSKLGDVKYSFSVKDRDLNIYLKSVTEIGSNLSDKKIIESETIKLEVRGNSLSTSFSNYNKKDKNFSFSVGNVLASDNPNIYLIDLGNNDILSQKEIIDKNVKSEDNLIIGINSLNNSSSVIGLKYPLNIELLKNGQSIQQLKINSKQEIISLNKISDSGVYNLKIQDGNGMSIMREIYLNSNEISDIDIKLGSNILLKGGSIGTSFFAIYDKFKNPVSGKRFIADLKLDGDFTFLDSEGSNLKNIKLDIYEGYRAFRIKSGDNSSNGKITISIIDPETNKILSTKTQNIKSLDSVNIKLENIDLTVGNDSKKIKLSIVDSLGNIISDFNSRVYFSSLEKYFTTQKPYFEIKNGVSEIEISSGNISGNKIPVEIQIEGISKIFNDNIIIKPLEPVKIDIITESSKIQANNDKFTYVTFELKDRYNNTVYTDSSTIPILDLDGAITLGPDNKNISNVKLPAFKNGVATVKIFAKDSPGVGYFKVRTEPDIGKNSFVIDNSTPQKEDKITVNGVGENTGKIETYYFLNKETLSRQNKEVGKNIPMNFNGLYTVLQGANYGDIEQKDYLAGAIVFDKNSRTLASTSIIDTGLNRNNIISVNNKGKFSEIFNSRDLSQDLDTNIGIDNNKIFFDIYNKSLNTNIGKIFYNLNDNVIGICEEGKKCFDDNKTGIYGKNISSNYSFKLSKDNLILSDNYGFEILSIDKFGNFIKKSDFELELEKDNSGNNLELKITKSNTTIANLLINIISPEINVVKNKDIFENRKNLKQNNSLIFFIESNFYGTYNSLDETLVFYNDPFSSKDTLDQFAKMNQSGFENYINNDGIGWKDDNKTLLSFSAGKTVGSSVKDFMGFYTINIGDPFLKLKTERKNFNGTNQNKQFDSTIGEIIAKDDDIVDYKVFDYNNDGRDDILLIKNNNYLELLENVNTYEKFLSRGNLAQIYDYASGLEVGDFTGDGFDDIFFVGTDGNPYLLNNISKNFTRFDLINKLDLNSKVSQVSAFDMDNDKIKDLVVLTESGELYIFYGGGTSANITFTKKKITDNLGLSLSKGTRKDNSFIYYSGLYQPTGLTNGLNNSLDQSSINNNLIDSEIFESVSYQKSSKIENLDNLQNITNNIEQTFFLKSQYFETVGLDYEKTFKDRNGGNLVSGDIVDVEIKLTNNTGRALTNIKFLEKFEKYFDIDTKTISNDKNIKINLGELGYNFGLDKFSLGNSETIIIKYSGKSKNINHVEIKTGYFEKDEPGDDLFGDILIDDFNRACKTTASIYKSTGVRDYEKSTVGEKCDMTDLPEELKKLEKDEDSNGIPDHIDEMKNSTPKAQEFGKEGLKELNKDSDGDGIPDETDFFDNLNGKIDEAQELLNGLSCGFSNGGCISTPLNWAPLAPGSDPTFMGKTIGDGLKVDEGLPIFSAITWIPCKVGRCPTFWPMSPLGPNMSPGAGGWLGIDSPTNKFRIFVTPTLTGGVGTAICFGATARAVGYGSAPMGFAPLFPGGNCIVMAKPLFKCSIDGSDGDPESVGFADNFSGFSTINGGAVGNKNNSGSCNVGTGKANISHDYVKEYIKSSGGKNNKDILGVGVFKTALENHSTYNGEPIFRIGSGEGTGISVSLSSKGAADFSDIEIINQTRIQPFPAFLMDWIQRQIDEIISKLTDFPTLFIILPDFSGIYDSEKSWEDNWKDYENKSSNNSGNKITQVNSGVREAYEFIGTLPLINLHQETVNVSIPWISDIEINRAIASRNQTLKQWQQELDKYKSLPSYDEKVFTEINGLIGSIKKNIAVIESYKKIPEKVKKLVNKKQDYLDQIICNIEEVSDLMGGWIGKNGERFKAWVELYILIKAILKSWQTFIDIFVDFEKECRECKNERHDLIDFQMQLISMIIPKIPVIEFPKWPDIVLDLHNIRAGLDLSIPDFEIKHRLINLPDLPRLTLPSVPNANISINLPNLPILPEFEIPELPDLPSLPNIELPNLPPPPKLPKLFEGFEFIIDIAKLVVKAMCLLKTSPLHPEWRAGDQIAFLTERNGFLSFDFLSKSLPKFTLPFVDSINITTYVNLEVESDFIVNFAESMVEPINSFTSDFTNKLNISADDLDFSSVVPNEVNVDVSLTGYQEALNDSLAGKAFIGRLVTNKILDGVTKANENKDILLTNAEFKDLVNKTLSSEKFSGQEFDDLRNTWSLVNRYNFSSEDKIIKSLENYNFEKYETLKNIFETEKVKNENLGKDLDKIFINGKIKVSNNSSSNLENYREEISKFNKVSFENIGKTLNFKEENSVYSEIKELGQDVKNKSKNTIGQRVKELETIKTPLENYKNGLLAVNNNPNALNPNTYGTCSAHTSGDKDGKYSYNYSGIYVLEKGNSYRLFDYIDEVNGDETTTPIDFDLDSDEDLLYFVNNTLYLKENFQNKNTKKVYLNEKPTIINSSSNKFLKNNFIESVNNVYESDISNGIINLSFSALEDIFNYRLSFYDIVDKHSNPYRNEIDLTKNKHIVDGISGSDEISIISEEENYVKRKDIAYISSVGYFREIELTNYVFDSIKDNLLAGRSVTVSSGTKIYSGQNYLEFSYRIDGENNTKTIKLEPNHNIEAKEDIIIMGISRGDGFINTGEIKTYNGDEVSKMRGYPLLFSSKLEFIGDKNSLKNNSYLDIGYYDNTELRLDFNNIKSWGLFDLGDIGKDYLFSISRKNDYFYSKINGFKNNIIGTSTKQILLSPQVKADKNTPDIDLKSLKIPIYQEVEIDITDKITEDSGIDGIRDIFIDFYLDIDTDGDLNPKNDNNTMPNLRIFKKDRRIFIKAGKFNSLINKKIGINIIDENGNNGFKEIDFVVYAPVPEIESYNGAMIYGVISEELKDEPINFYRFRGGNLSKLGDEKNNLTVFTNEKGEFELNSGTFKGGLTLKNEKGEEIAFISDKTGKITIEQKNKLKYNISVSREKETDYPEIFIKDNSGNNIFREILKVIGSTKIGIVSDFNNINGNGVYVKTSKDFDYGYYTLPENILNNPGVFVGFNKNDKNKTPIIKIYPDGRLEIPENFRINYSEFKDYVVLKINDNSGNNNFEVLYKIDADYVIN